MAGSRLACSSTSAVVAQTGVWAARQPKSEVGECCGSHFRRHLYAAPVRVQDPRLWQCSGCYAHNFKASDPVCRLCGVKSPDLKAREERERKRGERAQRKEEEAWHERERTGCLEGGDLLRAFLAGSQMRESGVGVEPKVQRQIPEKQAMEMFRTFSRLAGHEPEF
mmetsp:Transcript_6531/g.18511  ORF Transcript_6531/g.18511 Transcript_6531/m.18511 type:complete len:166 (-) Transcript_6531:101-598(-)